jgi:hypothetical protein
MAAKDALKDWDTPNKLTQEETLAALGLERIPRPEDNGKRPPNTLKAG